MRDLTVKESRAGAFFRWKNNFSLSNAFKGLSFRFISGTDTFCRIKVTANWLNQKKKGEFCEGALGSAIVSSAEKFLLHRLRSDNAKAKLNQVTFTFLKPLNAGHFVADMEIDDDSLLPLLTKVLSSLEPEPLPFEMSFPIYSVNAEVFAEASIIFEIRKES